MATIREAFRIWLAGESTITALVGTRIAPVRNSQRSGQPSIAYQVIGSTSPKSLKGNLNPKSITFRVDCWSTTDEAEAAAVANAVKDLVNGYRGMQSGIFFSKVTVEDAADNPADPQSGDDVGFFCESVQVKVLYKG